MITFISSPTEQTTAITDAMLSVMTIFVIISIYKAGIKHDKKKTLIWLSAFTFLAIAAGLGAIAHGFEMSEKVNFIIWQPLNLSLGITVALFFSGVLYDLNGGKISSPVLMTLIASAIVFYIITAFIPGSFFVFIIYEALAMLLAFVIYLILTFRRRSETYAYMSAGILISIIAAAIQATESVRFSFIMEFDHNGTFHLVQMLGLLFLLKGLRLGFRPQKE